jgi:hypothetical protein
MTPKCFFLLKQINMGIKNEELMLISNCSLKFTGEKLYNFEFSYLLFITSNVS